MRIAARISLAYRDEREARTVLEAILPDNVNAPRSLEIEAYTEDNRVITVIQYSGESLLTLQSTIDDLLSCVSVAEKSISALKE